MHKRLDTLHIPAQSFFDTFDTDQCFVCGLLQLLFIRTMYRRPIAYTRAHNYRPIKHRVVKIISEMWQYLWQKVSVNHVENLIQSLQNCWEIFPFFVCTSTIKFDGNINANRATVNNNISRSYVFESESHTFKIWKEKL